MAKTITLDHRASQFVEQKVAAGEAATADEFVSQLIADKLAQESSYDRWFRGKVMRGIADADANEFASPTEVDATLARWR
jgi:hypothetical protein